jgi:hypothetical protein
MTPPPFLLMLKMRHIDMKRNAFATEINKIGKPKRIKKFKHCGTPSTNKNMNPPWCCLPQFHLGPCSI